MLISLIEMYLIENFDNELSEPFDKLFDQNGSDLITSGSPYIQGM